MTDVTSSCERIRTTAAVVDVLLTVIPTRHDDYVIKIYDKRQSWETRQTGRIVRIRPRLNCITPNDGTRLAVFVEIMFFSVYSR